MSECHLFLLDMKINVTFFNTKKGLLPDHKIEDIPSHFVGALNTVLSHKECYDKNWTFSTQVVDLCRFVQK